MKANALEDYLRMYHQRMQNGDSGIERLPPAPYIDPWSDLPPGYGQEPSFTEWISYQEGFPGGSYRSTSEVQQREAERQRLMEMLYDALYGRR